MFKHILVPTDGSEMVRVKESQNSLNAASMLDLRFSAYEATPNSTRSACMLPLQTHRRGSDAPPARSASEDGRGGAAAPRLDKRTYLDGSEASQRLVTLGRSVPVWD
jgi:hypothetical protein